MTDDRYTELVKQAYEAQQAREGEVYKNLTCELSGIDGQLASLAHQRETVVAALEAMDDAIEGTKEALDAYFAGRDEGADEPTESDDALFEDEPDDDWPRAKPEPACDDEYSTAKYAGAYSD